jgi:hypothetical protein
MTQQLALIEPAKQEAGKTLLIIERRGHTRQVEPHVFYAEDGRYKYGWTIKGKVIT